MEHLVLYVKSKKISLGGSSTLEVHHGYVFGTSSGTAQKIVNYPPQDQEAINLLNQAKMSYGLVDLTDCSFSTRLKARLSGIKTPMLILNDKKVVGVENIRQALKDFKA